MSPIFETGIALHRELVKRGLELNPHKGRDAALHTTLAAKLNLRDQGFSKALADSNITAEEYLRSLVEVAQPFAQMFQKIWSYLAGHCAPKADESLFVRFGFDDEQPTTINWEQFRVMVESAEKILAVGPVVVWPQHELFELGGILLSSINSRRQYRDWYEKGRPFRLPTFDPVEAVDEVAVKVYRAIQSWIDLISDVWPLDEQEARGREMPELIRAEFEENSTDRNERLRHLAGILTNLVPIWRHILDDWPIIPHTVKTSAAEYFFQEIDPKIRQTLRKQWRSALEALDILDLPFWKHRWHTYEVWAAIIALEALDDFRPSLIIKAGHLALDAASPALVAILIGKQQIYVHAQGQTKLPKSFRKRNAIKPDMRFSLSDPATNESTVAIVEFKQRRILDIAHVSEVLNAYALGIGLPGGVVLINYDAIPKVIVPPNGELLGNVHPGHPAKVREYQAAVRSCFARAGILPSVTKRVVLLDVSGSMVALYTTAAAQQGLRAIIAVPNIKIFRFSNGLERGGDLRPNANMATRGGTELGAALQQMFSLPDVGIPDRMLIVTDGDHDRPTETLKKVVAYIECRPEEMENYVDWLKRID